MDWSKYSSLKSSKLASLGKEKQTTKEAVSEVKDDKGKVVRAAEAKEEREYVAMSQKRWDAESGEALDDSKQEWSLSDLEREKARCDDDMARAKAQSDGLKVAIADFKKL
jgi:flagellar hook assembly protein FlgD